MPVLAPPEAVSPSQLVPVASSLPPPNALLAGIAPMPVQGPAGFFGGLPYLFKVIVARWKRSSLIGTLKKEQQVEQRKLDEILRDLGKLARVHDLHLPVLEQVMAELRKLEGERGQTEAGKNELAARLAQDKANFEETSAESQQRIEEAQAQVKRLQATLKERQDELRGMRQRLAELDRQIKLETGQRDRRRAEAAKAKSSEQREAFEQAAAEVALKIGDDERKREAAQAEISAVDAPIAELTNELGSWKERLASAQKDLASARQSFAQREREAAAEDRKLSLQLTERDKTIADKFLEVGKILDAHRGVGPEQQKFDETYGRIDATRSGIARREGHATQLQEERQRYDRRGVKNGKILLLSGLGLVVLVTIMLIILFAVVLD